MGGTLNRYVWVDFLRSSITVLVVAHHSAMAYTTYAWFDKNAYINSTHAIVDTKKWIGLDIFINYNDVFFMSLMFLIGGLFLIKSINKKGSRHFIKDRFYRLLVPFLVLGTLLMLLAYFPAYYMAYGKWDLIAYVNDFFTVEKWPVGPPWFIWVLFLFNLLFALFHSQFYKLAEYIKTPISFFKNNYFAFFVCLFLITWILYTPMAIQFGAGTWIGLGPFDFQLSRIFLYFGYFIIGVLIGNTDFNNDVFSTKYAIIKMWWFWIILSLVSFSVLTIISNPLMEMVRNRELKETSAWAIYHGVFVISCTSTCLAFITMFRKFTSGEKLWMSSLSKNAYLIYLLHFVYVVWIQFILLKFTMPAIFKFLITFILALIFSWSTSILLRRIKIINKYL